MDIKWKSRIGLLAWLLLFTYGVSGVLAAIFDDHHYFKKNYFHTYQFERHVDEFLNYVYAFEIAYQPKEDVVKELTVTNSEIEEYRYRYGDLTSEVFNIEQQYEDRILEARNTGNQEAESFYIEERDKKIKEVTELFENDELIKDKILAEKEEQVNEYYRQLENQRSSYEKYKQAFVFHLKDTNTGKVFTNLSPTPSAKESIIEANMHTIRSYPTKDYDYLELNPEPIVWGYREIANLGNTDSFSLYEGKIGVTKKTPNSHFIMSEYHDFTIQKPLFWVFSFGAIIALVISIVIERKHKMLRRIAPEKWKEHYRKIPIDIAWVLFVISAMITLAIFFELSYLNYSNHLLGILEGIFYYLFWITVMFGLTWIQGAYLYPRTRDISFVKKDWRKAIVTRIFQSIGNMFLNRSVGIQMLLLFMIIFLFGLGAVFIAIEEEVIIVYLPALLVVGIPLSILIVRRLGYFNRILLHASAAANGKLEPDLEVKGKSVLAKLAEDINKLKYGVKMSQNAQAKSERLKTELITNVSHDLRTPLTSIMTYTELLKNPELGADERSAYIEIIDRKSKRLKVLIDDLFEVSKMASGNMELVKEKVDIVQLLQQALAEYNESIQESSIQFRVSNPEKPVYAVVDGQKLWRVFENLIGNILKYSLENTRAYISIKEENRQVLITFKNISKYELSENNDELIERFKRGDEARHTDGSGLGLAIAKSIIDLHQATLDIDVDGDLFKVTITLMAEDN
ncbi:histidine kinase dimerization/phospho-acceptor domain-containing protein [Bacillus salitolerans]|uniref:histidine kinase n=1 Tax=Bacillus salitolerans TaxID=1437434 RepID=A0ABW4LRX3_9BACI